MVKMGANILRDSKRLRRAQRHHSRPMAEINVTPFVDVMLVLLIVFMVAAPMLTVGVPVELPKTSANALPTEQEEPLTITVTSDGKILIQKTEASPQQLLGQLKAIAQERNSDRIYLRADGSISYERVVQVMGALNAGGFSKISLVTDVGGPDMVQPNP